MKAHADAGVAAVMMTNSPTNVTEKLRSMLKLELSTIISVASTTSPAKLKPNDSEADDANHSDGESKTRPRSKPDGAG